MVSKQGFKPKENLNSQTLENCFSAYNFWGENLVMIGLSWVGEKEMSAYSAMSDFSVIT